jgi:hypothetical protein
MSFKMHDHQPACEAGLHRRGGLALWIEDGTAHHWRNCAPGGQVRYTDAAIQTTPTARTAFTLPLRQTEDLVALACRFTVSVSPPDWSRT